MDLHKVAGVANAADLVTKHLGPGKAKDHLEAIGVTIGSGRAANAPTLTTGRLFSRAVLPPNLEGIRSNRWTVVRIFAVLLARVH